jgi:GT2 family glycosyltransferase
MNPRITVTIIIPSRPGTDTSFIRSQLDQLDKGDFAIETFFVSGTLPPQQRNLAISQSSGDFVFFLDDDILIPTDLILTTISAFDASNVAGVGGPNLTPPDDGFFAKLGGEVYSSYFGMGPASVRCRQASINRDATEKELHGSFLCFRGEVIRKFLFPEDIFPNDENRLINAIRAEGMRFYYVPDCYVYHRRRPTFGSFIRQIYLSGYGRGEQTRRDGFSGNTLYYIPALFLFYLILFPFFIAKNFRVIYPLQLYILLSILAAIQVCQKNSQVKYLLSAPLFFISHLTYAMGTIVGYFRPKNRKAGPVTLEIVRDIWPVPTGAH